jgi:hypothetical protein
VTFAECADRVDAAIRTQDRVPEAVRTNGSGESVTWARADAWATLTLHDGGRLELTLHTRADEHPQTLEILLDDPDAIQLIAEPAAALLGGRQQ